MLVLLVEVVDVIILISLIILILAIVKHVLHLDHILVAKIIHLIVKLEANVRLDVEALDRQQKHPQIVQGDVLIEGAT